MRLKDVCAWLFDGQHYRLKAELLRAIRVREAAGKRLAAARFVGDTREIHAADVAYRAATHDALRAEIAYRAVQPRRPSRAAKRSGLSTGSAR